MGGGWLRELQKVWRWRGSCPRHRLGRKSENQFRGAEGRSCQVPRVGVGEGRENSIWGPHRPGSASWFCRCRKSGHRNTRPEVCTKQRLVQSFCRNWSGERTKSFCSTVSRHCGDKISLGLTPAPTQGSCLGPGMGPGWGNPGAWARLTYRLKMQESNGFWGPEMLTLPAQPMDLRSTKSLRRTRGHSEKRGKMCPRLQERRAGR